MLRGESKNEKKQEHQTPQKHGGVKKYNKETEKKGKDLVVIRPKRKREKKRRGKKEKEGKKSDSKIF